MGHCIMLGTMFSIGFRGRLAFGQHVSDELRLFAVGEIVIGGFRQVFWSSLEVWTCTQYEAQWQDARERLRRGEDRAGFVTGAHGHPYREVFGAWRVGGEIRFQQRLAVRVTTRRDIHVSLGPYRTTTEDGERISDDWGVPIEAV